MPNPPLPSGDRILYLPRICPWNSIRLQYTARCRCHAFIRRRSIRTLGSTLILDGPEARHATRVLRLSARRSRRWCSTAPACAVLAEVVGGRGERLELRVLEPHTASRELPIAITVAPAVLKGDAMDALIRDATMLGAMAIAPDRHRADGRPGPRLGGATRWSSAGAASRWRRRSSAGAACCRRSPAARPLDAALRDPAWADATRLILCEPEIGARRRCRPR